MEIRTRIIVCGVLGVLAMVALAVVFLALTDIAHGEGDLSAEWRALQVSFAVISAFVVATIALLPRVWNLAAGGHGEVRQTDAVGELPDRR